MAAAETANVLLTPPPDNDRLRPTMDSAAEPVSFSPTQRRPSRPLDDSSEEERELVSRDRQGGLPSEHPDFDEDTTTTTTTTTTTVKLPKKHTSRNSKGGIEKLVAHHQAAHQKFASAAPAEEGNSSEPENRDRDRAVIAETSSTQQSSPTTVLAPSASLSILSHPIKSGQSSADTASESTTTTITSPIQRLSANSGSSSTLPHHTGDQSRVEALKMLPTSPSSDSLASTRSSTSPGTPSSVDNYQTISTTSTVTTRRRKLRRPTFEPRTSRLDPETMTKNQDPFRGFHTLFWIVMGAYGLITFDEEWTRVGKAFGGTLFSSFSQDAIILAISDFGLVFSTGFAFVLVKMFAKGWMRYMVSGMVVQHCLQLVFLLTAIAWTIWRDWPWVQSGFFTLHCITMLMKVHSYIAYNGELSEKKIQLKKIESAYAQMKRNDIQIMDDNDMDASAVAGNTDNDTSNDNHIDDLPTNDPVQEQEVYRRRHHRLASEAAAALLQDPAANPSGFDASMLASEVDELKNELRCQNGELWPANVTVANFVDYLLVPSLIYELQYPRTTRIRPMYVFEKSVATLGTFTLLYLTTEHYIYPVVFDPTISPMRAVVLLMIPFMMNYLMIFYIIFECICNAFAEISRFADRSFYEDWWNCVGFDEWARKWNKPVHHFLLRHVYDSSIESFHLSKKNAAFATFFLSSCVHELVMMVVTRKVRLYLFALQMFQLPLIWAGNIKLIRERPRLANAVFWLGMFCGPPLLGVAYCYA